MARVYAAVAGDRATGRMEGSHRALALGVPLCAGLALGAWFIAGGSDFALDDAYIHLSYARSLRRGLGASYNPHDLETGWSSPLWMLLLALLPLDAEPALPVKLVGIVLHALGAALVAQITLGVSTPDAHADAEAPAIGAWRRALAAAAAGLLAACTPHLLQGSTSGMEVSLTSLLILATSGAVLCDRPRWAAAGGALALWSRPEALFFLAPLGVARAWSGRSLRPLAAPAGAGLGLGLWMLHCQVVSGYPWPNTLYVKASGYSLAGLGYLQLRVLPEQPWLSSLGGAVLVGVALRRELLRRRPLLAWLLLGWLVTLVAIAVSRRMDPAVLFYMQRYYAIVAAVPAIGVGLGLAYAPRWLALLGAASLAAVCVWQVPEARELSHALEDDIARLHSDPSRYFAAHAPRDAVVVVEGAGAMRYRTPSSMTVVDMLGLNDRTLAHAASDTQRACLLIGRNPTHMVFESYWARPMGAVFELAPLRVFRDPMRFQTLPPSPREALMLRVLGARPEWRERCRRE